MHFSDLTGPLKYKLTNDYMFKAFLQRNEKALRGLLCALLRFKSEEFPEELYLDYFFVNRKTNHIYSDKVSIRMLQLNQLGNEEDEANMPDLYHWAQLFRATTWEEIAMLAEKNESIREGIVTLKELSEDEKIQMECEARERLRRDFASATSYGYRQGHEDGLEEGREEGNKQGIDKMSKLITILLGEKRYDELEKASNDDAYRNALFSRYNI